MMNWYENVNVWEIIYLENLIIVYWVSNKMIYKVMKIIKRYID